MTMTNEKTPDERVVQIAATGTIVYALTSSGRIFSAEKGRKALGWTELPDPLAPSETTVTARD